MVYSEADAGPGAEAGVGFRDYKNSFGSTCVAASVRPGSGLSSTDLPVNSTLVPCIYLSSLERHPHGSRRESWNKLGHPEGQPVSRL